VTYEKIRREYPRKLWSFFANLDMKPSKPSNAMALTPMRTVIPNVECRLYFHLRLHSKYLIA